jgi:hypothetical protein
MIERLSRGLRSQVTETIEPCGPVQIELHCGDSWRLDAKTVGWAAQLAVAKGCKIAVA